MKKLTDIWNNIRYFHYRFKHNYVYPVKVWLRNIWRFRKELAHTYPWDYSGLLLLMRRQVITMEECQRVHGNHLNAHKVAKDLRIVIKLLDRLIDDNYNVQTEGEYDWKDLEGGYSQLVVLKERQPKYIFPKGTSKQLYKHEDNIRKQDIDMLFTYMKQYRRWWN